MKAWELGPAQYHVAVAPSDSADVISGGFFSQVFVGGAGTITIRDMNGTDVQYTVIASTTLFIRGTRIKATGTAATLIVAQFGT